jgi:nucleoside-diphosphate-sugar epimerase
MRPKILITGSTGFVGRNLVPKLIFEGFEVLEITRDISKSLSLFRDKTKKIVVDDILFKQKVVDFKPDIVIHLAAYLTSSDSIVDIEKLLNTNLFFLSKLLDALSNSSIKLFVNTGTFAEYFYGDNLFLPAYYYAATKTASRSIVDYYSNAYRFKQATIVPYTIYGGKDSNKKIIDIIFDSIESKEKIDLSPGNQILDFIHINDVLEFYIKIIHNEVNLPIKTNFKLGTGIGHSIKDLANLIEKKTGKKTNINWSGKDYRKSDVMYAVADLTDNFFIDWSPSISLSEGLSLLKL